MTAPTPTTEAELFDYLQQRFGIGDYDEEISRIPYWRFRGTEIAKIKALLRRRHTTVAEVVIAAEYAIERDKPIYATWQLLGLVTEAKRAKRYADMAQPTGVRQQVLDAAAEAQALGLDDWAARLFAADEASGSLVLQQWRNR